MPPERRGRDLVWDGTLNVRDLGGHPTVDGRETRFHRIVRADNIRRLSDEGWRALADYGIRTIIDLRTDEELASDPPVDVPVEISHVPFMDDNEEMFREAERAALAAPDVAAATRDVYLIFLEASRPLVAHVFRTIVEAPEGGVVVHCMGGKDRTGVTVAFLLRMAGVGLDEIGADYALSEERLRPRHERWFAEAKDEAELERLKRIAATPAQAMIGVIEEIERRYGSVEGFLRAGGAPEDVGDRVRARLLG
ncbi:MAG TPA: tyrosine-protein phosphatase [Gaiellaceae bacterium]|nr:tyrosine-protein phosphatase [Gaiellaceae bacterium]